jgi:hypothetical protein
VRRGGRSSLISCRRPNTGPFWSPVWTADGPLAGPVVVAAVMLNPGLSLPGSVAPSASVLRGGKTFLICNAALVGGGGFGGRN